MLLRWWDHRRHWCTLDVHTSSETMGTHVSSSNKLNFLCEWEDILDCTIIITWFGVVLHRWNKNQLWNLYWTDGVCRTPLQLQRLDTTDTLYTKYEHIQVFANYLQLKDKDQHKGETTYINERTKATGDIVGFINNT